MGSRAGEVQVQESFGNILGGCEKETKNVCIAFLHLQSICGRQQIFVDDQQNHLRSRAETGAGVGGRSTGAAFVSESNLCHLYELFL